MSAIGPYPSMAKAIGRHPSIPRAERATPYILAKVKETKIVIAKQMIGTIVDMYPRAKPKMMLGADPILQASANSWTGV